MKTIKLEAKSKLILAALVFGALILVSGCGKKDKGTKVATTPGSTDPFCTSNCAHSSKILGQGLGKSPTAATPDGFMLGLSLYVTSDSATPVNITDSGFYSGPVHAEGVLFTAGAQLIGCPAMPDGRYTIRTLQPGQWDGSTGIFYNLILEARHTGGAIVKLHLADGAFQQVQPYMLDKENRSYPYGMWSTVIVESVGNCTSNLSQYFLSYM